MAKNGSFNTSGFSASDGSIYLVFSWEIQSQSIDNNTTAIKWTLKGGGTSAQWFQTGNIKVYLDGKSVYAPSGTIKLKSGDTVASGTHTVSHNDDGTGKFTASVTAGIYYYTSSNATGSATFVPDTIARASQPSLDTYPETTNDVGDFGEEFGIHMNRKSPSFTHTVRYEYGERSGVIARDVETGVRWAVPLDFMNDIPTATSGSGRIYVDTYNGSTFVGTKYTGFTATVPASTKPRCTIQVLDDTDIQNTYGNLVKGLSKLYVKTNFYAAYGSPVKSYNVYANGTRYTKGEIVTGFIGSAGTTTITATVTDKRGRTSDQATASFPVLDYAPPKITALAVHRCNADGTANDRGECVEVVFSGEVSPINNKNTAVYTVKYKKSADSAWTTLTTDVNGRKPADLTNNYAVYNNSFIFTADSNSSYDVEVSVADNHGTSARSTSASTAFTLMNFNESGNGIGIGQVSEKENTLQIGLDVEIKGKSIVDIVYPVGSIYLAYNHTNPGTLFAGTTWARLYGAFPWFTDANGQIGLTGGERTVKLELQNLPPHDHGGTYTNAGSARTHAWIAQSSLNQAMGFESISRGSGVAHNNMPPYIQISAWRRVS